MVRLFLNRFHAMATFRLWFYSKTCLPQRVMPFSPASFRQAVTFTTFICLQPERFSNYRYEDGLSLAHFVLSVFAIVWTLSISDT